MMIRTASAVVSVTPYMRTGDGLIECDGASIFTEDGPVSIASFGPLSAVASPNDVYGSTDSSGSSLAITNTTTVTATGGKPPYTYAWDGDSTLDIDVPNAASTSFSASLAPGDTSYGVYSCTVTDAGGRTAESNAVTASASNYRDPNGNAL